MAGIGVLWTPTISGDFPRISVWEILGWCLAKALPQP